MHNMSDQVSFLLLVLSYSPLKPVGYYLKVEKNGRNSSKLCLQEKKEKWKMDIFFNHYQKSISLSRLQGP